VDYSTYDIDFTDEGRRRVHLFSYVLGYSRRQYLRFVEAQDLPTTLREHIRAFEHLGGVARTCLYDNMKVVVLRHGDEVAQLLPLPTASYHVDAVNYRVVNVEGDIVYRQNRYSVPWRHIGQMLPVRISETELIVYSPKIEEIARHRLFARGATGQHSVLSGHRPSAAPRQTEAILRERFVELGANATRFLDGLLAGQRYGKDQACKVLALLATYACSDLLAAMERAVRFGAYSLNAIERILAAQAQPKDDLDILADQERDRLAPHLTDNPVLPRPTTDYQQLVEEPTDHAAPSEAPTPDEPATDDDTGRPA
jgi:hypothetical protein